MDPLPRGASFEFVDQVKGGVIPGTFIPAVEKGVREGLASGAIAGHPVVDVRVVLLDGKHHSVDSKAIAFVTAGRKAFIAAVRDAKPVVVEPIATLAITVPESAVGDFTGDLSARRGIVTGTVPGAPFAGQQVVVVQDQAPMAELDGYQGRLTALSGGQGHYTIAPSHHEIVPPSLQKQLQDAYKAHPDE